MNAVCRWEPTGFAGDFEAVRGTADSEVLGDVLARVPVGVHTLRSGDVVSVVDLARASTLAFHTQ